MSTLDDYATDGEDDDPVAIEDEECKCDGLPDGIPCLPCYMDGAEFGGRFS